MKRLRERQIRDALMIEGSQKIDEQRAELDRLRADRDALAVALEKVVRFSTPHPTDTLEDLPNDLRHILAIAKDALAKHGGKP